MSVRHAKGRMIGRRSLVPDAIIAECFQKGNNLGLLILVEVDPANSITEISPAGKSPFLP